MTPLEQLRAEAARIRDIDLEKVMLNYHAAMRQIRAMSRRLKSPLTPPPKKRPQARGLKLPKPGMPYRLMRTVQAAALILMEGEPLTIVELTLEVQGRGHRTEDEPRAVLHSIRSAMRYHKAKFRQDAEGRWSLIRVSVDS